ncbi:hypothetical protein PIB30_016952 [Stylosanthes scabra]|uniref:Uncharacterized protein n=1 Tax=Stylosanthes scabra TaxID=79078 RepID=A0ABU6Y634_9FABA|nr:hypothetical protein [Stylosanthes scabra]
MECPQDQDEAPAVGDQRDLPQLRVYSLRWKGMRWMKLRQSADVGFMPSCIFPELQKIRIGCFLGVHSSRLGCHTADILCGWIGMLKRMENRVADIENRLVGCTGEKEEAEYRVDCGFCGRGYNHMSD